MINKQQQGFSLIELMVSVTIFVIIVTIGMGAVITSNHAYNQTMRTSIGSDSISFVIEAMARRIRTGKDYQCGTSNPFACNLYFGSSSFTFIDQEGDIVEYYVSSEALERKINNESPQSLTNPASVKIKSFKFFGEGNEGGYSDDDVVQPRVTIVVTGEVPLRGGQTQEFQLQTSVTQRKLDI